MANQHENNKKIHNMLSLVTPAYYLIIYNLLKYFPPYFYDYEVIVSIHSSKLKKDEIKKNQIKSLFRCIISPETSLGLKKS